MTSLAASDTVHGFGKDAPEVAGPAARTRVLKEDALETNIFICYNALADLLSSRELQEFCLTASSSLTPRGQAPSDLTAVEKIPCLGKADPRYLLKAFEAGCDAVCLIGCAIGKCRTMDGNLRAQKRVALVRGLLEEIGLKGERLFLFLREPMPEQAARELIGQFLAEARALGPSELKAKSADGLTVGRTREDSTAEHTENAGTNA